MSTRGSTRVDAVGLSAYDLQNAPEAFYLSNPERWVFYDTANPSRRFSIDPNSQTFVSHGAFGANLDNARFVIAGQGDPYMQPYVDVGSPTTDTLVPWTFYQSAARAWYALAEDPLDVNSLPAAGGAAVYSVPNRLSSLSRGGLAPLTLRPLATNGGAGIAANAPIKRTTNALNGYFPLGFGTAVSGGSTMRMGTVAGALDPTKIYRIFAVAALRGTSFPYLMSVSGVAGNSLVSGNGSRQLRAGTDSQVFGSFVDSTPFLLSLERPGTEQLFDNGVAVSALVGRLNGAQVTTQATKAASGTADAAFVIGNRYDTDVATDLDVWEIVIYEGKVTQAEIYRAEGTLAWKYGMQASLPDDHPYRSGVPMVPIASSQPQFDVVTNPWGYRQVVKGYICELADGNIAAADGAQGAGASRRVLYDLRADERRRLGTQVLRGMYAYRDALGIYYRGGLNLDSGSGLYKGIGPEYTSQRKLRYELVQASGAAGVIPEYWSPAPYWKTTSSYANGVLWAGGAYSRATTLDSIRTTGPTITAVTKASPGVVTYSGTDPAAGALVYITGVVGMTQLNGRFFKIASLNTGTKTFALTDTVGVNVDSTAYGTWTSGGTLGFDYALQCDAWTTQIVADLEDIHSHDTYPIRVVGFGLQNEPLGADASYGSCLYTATLYIDVLKNLLPKIRASAKLSTWGGSPNTVQIHADSWGGPWDTICTGIIADTVTLTTGKTLVQELAHWTTHNIGAINADPNVMLTGDGSTSSATGKEYYAYRVTATNPQGQPVYSNEYERFDTPASRDVQFAQFALPALNFLAWTQAPMVTLIHAAKPSTDPNAEKYALAAWRVPGDVGAVATTYAAGLDYGKFATIDCNLNAMLPFIRRIKGAQVLLTQESAYSATRRVLSFFDAYGKLIVFVLNAGAAASTFTINLGAQVRTMRGYQYSATQRDVLVGNGATISTCITTTLPPYAMQVWSEA